MYFIPTQYFSRNKIEKNAKGVAYGPLGVRRGLYIVLEEKPKEIIQLEYPSLDGRIILRRIFSRYIVGT
jgi:hypothetical protein